MTKLGRSERFFSEFGGVKRTHSREIYRKDGEGVRTYVAALCKLSEHCNYGETLPEMLRDRLVCGINNDKMQRRLLAEPDLTLKKAEEIALAMELASKHVVDIQSTDATPSKVNQVNSAARNKGKNLVQVQNAIVVARNTKLSPGDLKMHNVLNVGSEVI